MSKDSEPCREKGCTATLFFDTDGNGRTVAVCPACEKRKLHFAAVLRVLNAPLKCVYGNEIPRVRRGMQRKFCEACRPLEAARKRLRG